MGGTPVSSDGEIQTACARTVTVPHERRSSTFSSSTAGTGHGCTRLASIIPRRIVGIGLETRIEVWYGTMTGKLGVVQFQSTGVHVEVSYVMYTYIFR